MEYLYFKSKHGNFGDDLNPWLWPQLFKGINTETTDVFLGIGSILHNENAVLHTLQGRKKIVFGTGIRPSSIYTNLKMDESWDVKFLRGPLSATALKRKYDYITDAAYALRQLPDFDQVIKQEKKYEVSLMPYFHSVEYFDWKEICKELGYHYISPFSENGVEETLHEIAASKVLITEAMHGAIIADILRVPWHRFILTTPYTEGAMVSEFKWSDWLQSVGVFQPEVTFINFYKKTRIHGWLKNFSRKVISTEFLLTAKIREDILAKLAGAKPTYLSDDLIVKEIDDKIAGKVQELIHEHQ